MLLKYREKGKKMDSLRKEIKRHLPNRHYRRTELQRTEERK